MGWVGWLVDKAGSKNTLSKVLNPQKRQVLKTSQIFGKWERNYKLNNSIILILFNSGFFLICLILAFS